jgi:hypothetical protein
MKLGGSAWIALAAGAFVLAACGGGGGDAGAGPRTLRELFEGRFDAEAMARQEEAIRDCMVAQGFEYTPVDRRGDIQIREVNLEDEEWVRQNGFGITTNFPPDRDQQPSEENDPNRAYRQSLSAEQQEAYDRALFGESRDVPGNGPVTSGASGGPGFSTFGGEGGCLAQALEESGADFGDSALDDALQELEEQIRNDARVIEANQEWAACMSDRGYTYASREEAIEDIASRFREIIGAETPGGDEDEGGIAIIIGGDPNAEYDQEALAELREEEIAVALAAFECGKDSIDGVLREVREEYEAQFIDQHPELTAE